MRATNWARNHRWQPAARAVPATEAEVVALVAQARERGHRVKAIGAGHSWSDAAVTAGTQVSLDGLRRVLAVDLATGCVRVEAGIRLHELSTALAPHGLTLQNLGSIAQQSLAGAIATATHGTGLNNGHLGTQIVGARVVTGTGAVVSLDAQDQRLDAVRVHLGALGVVTELTSMV